MNQLALLSLLVAVPPQEPARESQSPYQLTVCLRVADDPLITARFVNGISREVRDQLKNYFGPLANVNVITSGHWLIDDYADDDVDLPFIDAEIMQARELKEQAFVFRINFDRTHYDIRWRQLDGPSGQIGPIQSRQTPDRQWVAKTICLAVRDDFAVRADITQGSTPGTIAVSFVGKEHKAYLDRVLGERIFMQLYWVVKRRADVERRAVPHAFVLWINDKNGPSASVVPSHASPQSRAGVSYEAVRIHTQPGRLRLHLVDQERLTPVTNRVVSANDRGFASLTTSDIMPNAKNSRGVLLSRNVLDHIAYVRIDQGGNANVDVPLPITQDICDYVLPIAADRQLMAKNDYERNLRFLTQDLQTLSTIQSTAADAANELNGRKRYEEALKKVAEVVSVSSPQLASAGSAIVDLQRQAKELQIKSTKQLDLANTGLKQLQDRHAELSELHAAIGNAIEKRDAQGRADVLVELGKQAEQDADFDEAITRYELALGEQSDNPVLTKKLADLKEQWRIKGPNHEAARKLVYDRWASAEITELATLLPEVKGALDTLKSEGDNLTARKLLNANSSHLALLNDLVARLAERTSDEDRKETEKYVALTEAIATFQEAVANFISDGPSRVPAESDVKDETKAATPEPPKQTAQDGASAPTSLLDLDGEEEKPRDDNGGKK
jgi:hypothetical protein